MDIQNDIIQAMRSTSPALELYLGHGIFATGRQLGGVVLFRVARQTRIRSLIVSVTGCETIAGTPFPHAMRRSISFFGREVLLSGRDRPRFRHERISRLWSEFLGRDTGRVLSAGQHMYPFSIPLPASLPPSYQGKAGTIAYTVTARIELPLGQSIQVSKELPIVFIPRLQKTSPVALSCPASDGTVHPGDITINVELIERSVEVGKCVTGRFTIANKKRQEIKNVTASLENCEWVRGAVQKEIGRGVVESTVIEPEDTTAGFIEGRFELRVPRDAAPTVEGTAISVLWFLKIYLDTARPLEFKAPITVYISQ